MITELFIGTQRSVVGVVQFDCTLSVNYSDSCEITSHSVEDGEDISDNIRPLAATIELNGLVSNTPIALLGGLTAKSPVLTDTVNPDDRVEAAYSALLKAKDEGTLLDVGTSLRSYENMAIENLNVIRDAANGNVLNCTISLRKIVIATTETEPIPVQSAVKKAKDKGKKQKESSSEAQTAKVQSILSKLAGGLG